MTSRYRAALSIPSRFTRVACSSMCVNNVSETCWSLSTEPLQANWVYLPSSSMLHLPEARGGPLAVVMGIPVAFAHLACDTAAYPRRVGAPQTLGSVRKGRWTEESGADAFFQRFMYQDTPP